MWERKIVLLWISILTALSSCALLVDESDIHGLIYESNEVLWVLDPEQGGKVPLVKRSDIDAYFAIALSTDLTRIAYSTDSYDLRMSNLDGTNEKALITEQLRNTGLAITRMSWSPGSEKLAVFATPVEDPSVNLESMTLYIVDLSTDGIQAVAKGVTEFAWMQDSKQLAIVKRFDQTESPGVYLVSADGSTSRQLFEGLAEPYIAISPNGDKIAFVSDRPGSEPQFSLFVVDPSLEDTVDLLKNFELPFHSIEFPTWSPDGRSIAFIAWLATDTGLFVLDLQTQTLQEITSGRGLLAWSPNGRSIAMSGPSGIHQFSIETSEAQKMTDDLLSTPENFRWE